MRVQYPAQGAVSIWVGSFSDEDAMDSCTDGVIEPSLNLPVSMAEICEISFEDDLVSVREILEGFSGWESFIDEACEVSKINGITLVNSALVCYHLLCDAPINQWKDIVFLGTFIGRDVGESTDE